MRPSRGMGAIKSSKVPKTKKTVRKSNKTSVGNFSVAVKPRAMKMLGK
jgi:hypothetical protein